MGTGIECWIEYDDYGDPPFSGPGTEVLGFDCWPRLDGAKDYPVYGAISGVRSETNTPPLFALRGMPGNPSIEVAKALEGEQGTIGWLFPDEVFKAIEKHNVMDVPMSVEMDSTLLVLHHLATRLGNDRVRFVFEIK
jgi:hypothetical protein